MDIESCGHGFFSGRIVVVAAAEVISCDLEGEAALLNLKNGVYYGLDRVGAMVWRVIQEPVPADTVRDAVVREYDVEPDRCERDLAALFRDLAAHGLVSIHEKPAG